GILAQWEAPAYTEPVTYALYRSDGADITSVVGLTPLATGITDTMAVDPKPSPSDHCYAVTAVDGVGNESAPSNSYYLNFQLLPVSTLNVAQADMGSPIVSWTHPGGDIAGYDVYLTTAAQSWVKLNSSLITGHEYEDWGYNGDTRAYTVIAKDYAGMESPGRRIVMPDMSAAMVDAGGIKRGIMNRVEYVVENRSTEPVANARLRVRVNEVDHLSETFDLDPASSGVAPVTIGGYADLEEIEPLTVGIEMTPNQGETVSIVRTSEIEVGHGMMVMRICNEEFTRGGTGTVWFTLENTGEAEIEIVTARSWGNAPSDEMTFFLEDADGNVLSTADVKQGIGEDIVTLSNGKSVARIPAGDIFTSAPMAIFVPANAPDDITVRLTIDHIYFHCGRDDQVRMDGLSTTHDIALVDTSYYGEILSVTPEQSDGTEDIVIAGRAVDRSTGLPLGRVPLILEITVRGFDREYDVFTADDGSFTQAFTPLSGEAGLYEVRAVHPDLLDRPIQAQFVITRVNVSPTTINMSIPYNYEQLRAGRQHQGEHGRGHGSQQSGTHVGGDCPAPGVVSHGRSRNARPGARVHGGR
ncbi:MAG: hypothetical protein JRK53_28745, partial [Deltaproteobacteria bacterium]|nr:hypothetical protein [Deltaproteobacteria bacterium]